MRYFPFFERFYRSLKVFTDEEDAVDGVKSGKYYAAIVIPETFSADLLQIEDGTLGGPEITYYVNEKRNAVAPKITNTGSTTIQSKIEEEFYKVASEAIAEELQNLGGSLADDLETTNDNILSMISDAGTSASERTDAGKDATPLVTIRKPERPSSRMFSARRRLR